LGQAIASVRATGDAAQHASQNEATHIQPSKYQPVQSPAAAAMGICVPDRGMFFKTFLTF
jgi:hypothetical protein